MTIILRPYQRAAVDAVFSYWNEYPGNPLVDMATGTGKSASMATLTQEICVGWPDMRIVIATHVAELIEQNYLELVGMWFTAPAGIVSAGLNQYRYNAQIVFAGIQTVWNKAERLGHVDILIVDEAHLIPANSATMYGKFIAALREINSDMKIVGFTATPYRLDSGRLDEGEGRLFDRVVYTYGIEDGIKDGYLAPLTSKATETGFDLSGVGRLGGDYKQGALQAAVDKDATTRAAVDEIFSYGANRRSWLCFCAGVEHALHVRDEIRRRGISCETITGDTPKDERRKILDDYKNYRVKCLTNNSVLTTGFNHKGVDLIAAMRPTLSTSLYVQMMGRGTRPLYADGSDLTTAEGRIEGIAAGPKPNCLVLDFAGLIRRHGPVDMVEPKKPGKGDGDAPVKECPKCHELVHASVRVCPECEFEFPESDKPKHDAQAAAVPVMSKAEATWVPVSSRTLHFHEAKDPTKKPTVRVDYRCGVTIHKEWMCPAHTGFPKSRADRWWRDHGGKLPFPASVQEFIDRQDELNFTSEISIKPNGRYYEVTGYRAGDSREIDIPF